MGRMYSATFENVAVTAVQDIFSLLPAVDKPVKLHAVYLGQITDVGDSAEEILRINIGVGHTTVGSGGAAVTANPISPNDAADGATVRRNDTIQASVGTEVIHHSESMNIRVGMQYRPTPEERISVENNQHLVVALDGAPADSITMSGTLLFEEMI